MSTYSSSNIPAGIQIYATASQFPAGGQQGDQLLAADTNTIYAWNSTSNTWIAVATPAAAIAIDALTGDVTATGPGVVAATVAKIGGTAVSGSTGNTNVVFSNAPTLTGNLNLSSLTASQILALDGSSNIQSLTTATYPSLTELSYVKGVTSAIQTQLGNKQPFAAVVRITKSANYLAASTDDYIGCNTTGGAFTISLPSAATVANGKKLIIKDEGGNATTNHLSITPNGTNTIDGSNSTTLLSVNFESLTLVCNGADSWFIM